MNENDHSPIVKINQSVNVLIDLLVQRLRQATGPGEYLAQEDPAPPKPWSDEEIHRLFAFLVGSVAQLPLPDQPAVHLPEKATLVHCLNEALIDIAGHRLIGAEVNLKQANPFALATLRLGIRERLEESMELSIPVQALCMLWTVIGGLAHYRRPPDGHLVPLSQGLLGVDGPGGVVQFCHQQNADGPTFDQELVERAIAVLKAELCWLMKSRRTGRFHAWQFGMAVADFAIQLEDRHENIRTVPPELLAQEIDSALLAIYLSLKGLEYFREWHLEPDSACWWVRQDGPNLMTVYLPGLGELPLTSEGVLTPAFAAALKYQH